MPGSPRDLADPYPWEASLARSRARRRAAQLKFVPAASRVKRLSLGTLVAMAAGPAAGLADAHGKPAASGEPASTASHFILLQSGSEGRQVALLQHALGIPADGIFGPETEAAVRAFQESHGLSVDGVVGPQTGAALAGSSAPGIRPAVATAADLAHAPHPAADVSTGGDPVVRLQEALGVQVDGTFGHETEHAVRAFQASHGLSVDGVVGPETWRALHVKESVTLHPPHAHHHSESSSSSGGGSSSSSSDSAGGESPSVVARVIAAADEIATRPYVYGGGHGSFQASGYDCSGSVSYALHGGGLLGSPEDSSELESYGEPGPGRHITVYANSEHAWMVIDGRRFDTIAEQETGTRWSSTIPSSAGYVVRHPAGL